MRGEKAQNIFSESIVDYVIKTGTLRILGEFKEDIVKEKLIKVLLYLSKKSDFTFESVKELGEISSISILKILVEVVFYSEQTDETLPLLSKLENLIMQQINLGDLAKPDFIQLLRLRLNNILPNATQLNRKLHPVPALFLPFLLKIVVLLHKKAGMAKPWELFLEFIVLLIKADKIHENIVWQGVVRFATMFDIDWAEKELVRWMKPEDSDRLLDEIQTARN